MSVARAYLSIFPSEKSEEIVKNINGNMKSIRFELVPAYATNYALSPN